MTIEISGAREHNLKNIDVLFDGMLTVVTGVSGSGKSSLVFDTLYHEARRRFLDVYALGSVAERLMPAKVRHINGLRPAVAVGQDLLNRNPNSTVASASGLSPLLRVLYARFGQRHCPSCGERIEALNRAIIAQRLANLSAMGPLAVWAPIVQEVPGSHESLLRFLIDKFGPSSLRVDNQPLLHSAEGIPENLDLDLGAAHTIELVIATLDGEITEIAANGIADRAMAMGAWGIRIETEDDSHLLAIAALCTSCGMPFRQLEPADFNRRCQKCQGEGCPFCANSGIGPEAAAVGWAGYTLPEFSKLSVSEASELFQDMGPARLSAELSTEIMKRLVALQKMGLGYLNLDRAAPSLSRGEGQRLRLAVALSSQLEDILYVLDEPTIGQHPADVNRLLSSIRQLNGQIVIVEHDRQAAAVADQVIDLGPGGGAHGGQLLYSGSPEGLWASDTVTGRHFGLRNVVRHSEKRPEAEHFLKLQGVYLRNLDHIDVSIPVGRLTVVTGVSGSGKSTLVDDVLVASLDTSEPIGCLAVDGPRLRPLIVDQKPIGRNPRSNPATYTKLSDILRDLFAAASSLPASCFSFNRSEGACRACKGMGAIEVRMRYLPSTWIPCASCDGARFSDEVLSQSLDVDGTAYSIADIYQLSVIEALSLFKGSDSLSQAQRRRALKIVKALIDVGLGYLALGQPSPSLSGGEAQRLKLARVLGRKNTTNRLLVLDEPTTGLHPYDTAKLLQILDRLVKNGTTVVIVEHNLDVIRAADWIIDLGPGAGPNGGRLIYSGPAAELESDRNSLTAEALRSEANMGPGSPPSLDKSKLASSAISIRNARAHNLKGIDVDIPKDAITVVTGLSGAGKSSLVHDVLEDEARRRFLESLSMYERQGARAGPEANADQVSGIGVVVSVKPERRLFDRRATVGTATEVSHHLALLLTWVGQRRCLACEGPMQAHRVIASGLIWQCPTCQALAQVDARHFSPWHYAAACLTCNGVGTLQVPNPDKLIIHPDRPLCDGAMHSPGFFPKGYLCKPLNGGYDMVQALAKRYDFDPFSTPWQAMDVRAKEAFLYGDPKPMPVHFRTRNQSYVRQQPFPGFYGFIRDWDVGGTYTDTETCPDCRGARLRPQHLAVRLDGHNFHDLSTMDLNSLAEIVEGVQDALADGLPNRQLKRPSELIDSSCRVIARRLHFLAQVGVGYLNLNRLTATLSAGEAQRIKLAGLLGGELSGLTVLLDEPTRGLHPSEVNALVEALQRLRDQGNCVIVIEHDLKVIEAANHVIEVGPEAGAGGGTIVVQGTPAEVANSSAATGRWLRRHRRLTRSPVRSVPSEWIIIRGARANNLSINSLSIPRRRLVGVCGVSGSGKSTLVVDTIGRALAPKKHTTSVASEPLEPGRHDNISGAPARTVIVDQTRAGVTSPASFLGLDQPLRRLFAESEQAQELSLTASDFARNCPACKGRGLSKTDLGFLPPLSMPCEACEGSGYGAAARQVRAAGFTLPELSDLTIVELLERSGREESLDIPAVRRPLEAAAAVGLGYLVLRQPGHALSGGEAQRLKIARQLCRKTKGETLFILDEPSLGQHMEDLQRMHAVLDQLVAAGNSVIVVEHHAHILAECDWLIELGPGGGASGGQVIFSGEPGDLSIGNTPMATYLKAVISHQERT